MKSSVLSLDSVTKSYNGAQVLRPCSLLVEEGDYISINGPSGSGKSTILNIMGLLDEPNSGSVTVNGNQIHKLSDAHRSSVRGQFIGFVFQSFHLISSRNVVQNIELGMLYRPWAALRKREVALQAVDRVGLSHRMHAKPNTLSGGEQQRVAIARALAGGPRILLADEPTGNLDAANTSEILSLFDEVNATGVAVVVITHDEAVASRAKRRLSVCDGRLCEDLP